MRSGTAATAALMLALALIPAGCGDEQSTAASAGGESARVARTAPPERRAGAKIRAGAMPRGEARRCRRALGDFLDATESLANSVAVGVSYAGYLAAVKGARVSYARIEADELGLLCLARVASRAEAALNVYIEAANEWGGCLADSSCDPESVEAGLQRRWRRASDPIASAQDGLRRG